jgi:hypothetical protein
LKTLFSFLLFFALTSFTSEANYFSDDPNAIRWSADRLLKYEDFQAPVPSTLIRAAMTTSGIFFHYQSRDNKVISFQVHAEFYPDKSWMKVKTPDVLSHEQNHFNIMEVYARKLYVQAKAGLGYDSPQQFNQLFNHINVESQHMQDEYDNETVHGTLPVPQRQWIDKVNQWLLQYPEYSDDVSDQ